MSEPRNRIGFMTLLGRECHRFLRMANQTLIPPMITTTLYILIFGYSLGSRIRNIHEFSYMQFMVPGLIMMSVISGAYQNTSGSLYIARFQGSIQELLVSSLSDFEIVLAMVLGGVIRGICVGVLVTIVAVLLARVPVENVGVVIFFVVTVSLIFSCLGFLSGLWSDDFDQLSVFQTYILTPLTYLGGVFFAVDMLPVFWQRVAAANPILYFVNGLRYGFLGITDVSPVAATVIVVVVAAVGFGACYGLFRRGYHIKT